MKVLVTGSSQGIGRAVCLFFLQKGHEIYGIDMKGSSISHENYHHFVADITKKETLPEIGDIDAIFLNAGVQDEEKAIATNLEGTIKVFSKYESSSSLKAILFNASASARTGDEFPLYAASKAGVVGFMKNAAMKLAKRGITVNSISLGGVITESNSLVMKDEASWEKIMEATPLKKWASEEEVAEWVYFLLAYNKSMSGQDILIDNGEASLRSSFVWPED